MKIIKVRGVFHGDNLGEGRFCEDSLGVFMEIIQVGGVFMRIIKVS
jgi:hypothetical protein